jgi:ABC-type Fe3+/spermidine/putrescine transport system ATPase subunit
MTTTFQGRAAVPGKSLSAGGFTLLIGPSGCGMSTLPRWPNSAAIQLHAAIE